MIKEETPLLPTTKERWAEYGAGAVSFALGSIHFIVNFIGYLQAPAVEQNPWLFLAWGIFPSLLCFAVAIAALGLAHFWGGRTFFRLWFTLAWIAFVLMSLQDAWHLILVILRRDFSIFLQVLGPGPWSLIGAILFGFIVWQVRRRSGKTDELQLRPQA